MIYRFNYLFFCIFITLTNTCLIESARLFEKRLHNILLKDLSNQTTQLLGKDTIGYIWSPIALKHLLLCISLGTNGKTSKEIDQVLNIDKKFEGKMDLLKLFKKNIPNDEFIELDIKQYMFIRNDIELKKDYKALIKKYIQIEQFAINNTASLEIVFNEKIKTSTKRKTSDMFTGNDFNKETTIVYGSYIYYKNRWLYPPTVLNGRHNFTQKNETFQLVMFRINGMMPFFDMKIWGAKIIDIPFNTKNVSMLIFLPNDKNGLKSLGNKIIKAKDIINFTNTIMKPKPISITLPNFSLESTTIFPNKLQKVGINELFKEDVDLSKMTSNKNIKINTIVQKVKLWANQGRGAFKDTGDIEYPIPEEILFADHPFCFILKAFNLPFIMGHFAL